MYVYIYIFPHIERKLKRLHVKPAVLFRGTRMRFDRSLGDFRGSGLGLLRGQGFNCSGCILIVALHDY